VFFRYKGPKSVRRKNLEKEIPSPYPGDACFFCGTMNPIGLKLKFFLEEETGEVSTKYLPAPHFRGLGRILHGGIQSGLFDEIMGWTAHTLSKEMGVTTDLQVKFLKPVYLGVPLKVFCRIHSRKGPKVHLEASIRQGGATCTTGTGTYYLLPPARFAEITEGRDGE
jgi:acyl-coenzyme A thioesterase PaaI-like protein